MKRILFLRYGCVEADSDHETLLLTCAAYAAAYDFWEAAERAERALTRSA